MSDTKKQLVVVVDGSTALAPHWPIIFQSYVKKIIRSFCGDEATEADTPYVELALVVFNAHGSYSPLLVHRSEWTRCESSFLEWLSNLKLDGFCESAIAKGIAEGLTEVLMMCPSPIENQTQQNEGLQRHCILVAASNPYPLHTHCIRDAETIAKSFPQSCISLSVICPRQLPKLKAIYNAGKRNPSAADPTVEVVENQHVVLISKNFREACAALCPLGVTNTPLNQTPEKKASTSVSPGLVSRLNQQSAFEDNDAKFPSVVSHSPVNAVNATDVMLQSTNAPRVVFRHYQPTAGEYPINYPPPCKRLRANCEVHEPTPLKKINFPPPRTRLRTNGEVHEPTANYGIVAPLVIFDNNPITAMDYDRPPPLKSLHLRLSPIT